MKQLAAVFTDDVQKIMYTDTQIGENTFRKIICPVKKTKFTDFWLYRLTKGFDKLSDINGADPVKLVLKNLSSVMERLKADNTAFFIGSANQAEYALPYVLRCKNTTVVSPPYLQEELEDFFMDNAGAACVIPCNVKPNMDEKTVVFLPGAKGLALPEARAVLDLCGSCSGSNVIRAENICFKPPRILENIVSDNTILMAQLCEYFNLDYDNLYVFSAKMPKHTEF